MAQDSLFEPPGNQPGSPATKHLTRAGLGRPKGAMNKRSRVLWRQAEVAGSNILAQRIQEAEKFSEYMKCGNIEKAKLAFQAGTHLLFRILLRTGGGRDGSVAVFEQGV